MDVELLRNPLTGLAGCAIPFDAIPGIAFNRMGHLIAIDEALWKGSLMGGEPNEAMRDEITSLQSEFSRIAEFMFDSRNEMGWGLE